MPEIIEAVGYLASGLTALSLVFISGLKFRWFNTFGATVFIIYGLLVPVYPVVFTNIVILGIDAYFLIKIYTRKEHFKVLKIGSNDPYMIEFLNYYDKQIQKFYSGFTYQPAPNLLNFTILRNMLPVGIFISHRENETTLQIDMDFVIEGYRDYKNGKFLYEILRKTLKEEGIKKIEIIPQDLRHLKYLEHIGFEEDNRNWYILNL